MHKTTHDGDGDMYAQTRPNESTRRRVLFCLVVEKICIIRTPGYEADENLKQVSNKIVHFAFKKCDFPKGKPLTIYIRGGDTLSTSSGVPQSASFETSVSECTKRHTTGTGAKR